MPQPIDGIQDQIAVLMHYDSTASAQAEPIERLPGENLNAWAARIRNRAQQLSATSLIGDQNPIYFMTVAGIIESRLSSPNASAVEASTLESLLSPPAK
jgi:hypothetical protein